MIPFPEETAMDRKKQIAALTDDEGERLLLAQACERLTRAEQRGIPAAGPAAAAPAAVPLLGRHTGRGASRGLLAA